MTKKLFKKIILSIAFFSLFIGLKTQAITVSFDIIKSSVYVEEEFYIDLILNTENISINGIEGKIFFPEENLSFIRAENGKSMINLWVQPPKLNQNSIEFAGVTSYGFDGVIDPFNLNKKLPGLIIRLVFVPKKSGEVEFTTSKFLLYLKDGNGTMIEVQPIFGSIFVGHKNEIDSSPKPIVYITQDINFYNNKNILIVILFTIIILLFIKKFNNKKGKT